MRVLFAALVACLGVAAALGAHAPWSLVAVAVLCAALSGTSALVHRRHGRRHRVR
jgi:hypothetical protein